MWIFLKTAKNASALKIGPPIVAIAAGLIAYTLIRKGAGIGMLQFLPGKIVSISYTDVPVITFGILVQNTSGQSFTLRSIAGNITANNYHVGNVSNFNAQTVAAHSEKMILINARLNTIGIVNDIIRAFVNGNFVQEIKVNATANVDNLQLPILLTYKVGQ